MSLEEQIIEMKKRGCSYREMSKETNIGNLKIAAILRNAGLIDEQRKNSVSKSDNPSERIPVTCDDIRELKAVIKVGTRIKVRTQKCVSWDNDEKKSKDTSIFRTGTVTSVNNKRFMTMKYDSGVVESFLWSEIVAMRRKGRCKIVRW